MEILNVIETSSGLISNIASYIVPSKDGPERNIAVSNAENYFARICTRLGHMGDRKDMESFIEDGYFYSGDRDVSLVWSVNVFQ